MIRIFLCVCLLLTLPVPSAWADNETVTYPGDSLNPFLSIGMTGFSNALAPSNASNSNHVTVNAGSPGFVFGGYNTTGASTGNTVILNSGANVNYSVFGGYATNGGSATGNTVILNSGAAATNVYGGWADGSGSASGNTVILNPGATVNVDVYGGFLSNSGVTADNNTVIFHSGATVNGHVYGGTRFGTTPIGTGNTLELKGSGQSIGGDLAGFQNLNFYLPSTLTGGQTMLTVGGTATLTGATVNVGIDGASSPLAKGDQVVLIDAATLTGTAANTTSNGQGMQGVTLQYEFGITTVGNQLLATVNNTGAQVNEQTKALSEGFLSGMAHVRQGQETLLNMLDNQNINRRSGQEFSALARLQGGSSRHDSGFSIWVNSRYLSVGALWQPERNDRLSLAGLLELGEGDYHSRNHFDNRASVKGRGDMESAGAAVLARWNVPELAKNAWLETSVRGGHIRQDFKTHDLVSSGGHPGNYHLSTSYWGAHIGIGNRWEVAPGQEFDARAQLLWSQEKGKSVTLKSGDFVKFRTTDSERLILGGRYNWKVNTDSGSLGNSGVGNSTKLFAGLAWEHEFSAKAKATAYNLYAIDAPDLKGSTGIAEFGVTHQTGRLKLDAGINASGGKREGTGGFVQVNWKF